ncbi:hypothetical protein D3C78_1639550 [compost metagenome]
METLRLKPVQPSDVSFNARLKATLAALTRRPCESKTMSCSPAGPATNKLRGGKRRSSRLSRSRNSCQLPSAASGPLSLMV